ncbi:oligosaccharide flippase family protein [Virgibacillus sp. 179-BFC.A HS]|uniref:Oligosaccharide flippase family protein n=1 Tax=Tigheibacillus jepli TaxID=3035914 RepID=A0ABU5CEI8_9BACI|nr:oligosaccharide flippase family protein [Virgibacillus sp. 179-BFC.A HS]MDY0404728.1 oligosaccharide flippase family protein [Virgibacillus sp. 179-BFC.A HS]
METRKLVNDTMLYGIANFGSGILTFLMLPLYTYYFTATEFGYWDVMVTTATLFSPFVTFELVSAVYRWLLVEEDTRRHQVLITTGLFRIICNLILLDMVAIIVFSFVSIPYGWLALAYLHVIIATSFLQQCARGLHRNKLFAGMGIMQTILSLVAILFLMFALHLRVEAFFYANIFAGCCVAAFAWWKLRFHQYIALQAYSKQTLKAFLIYAIPIIPGAASWWLMTMSDRYFITGFLGLEANGIYALANKIPAILLMVNTVFALAWKDHAILAFQTKEKNAYYTAVFKHFFRLMATAFICIVLFSKPILALAVSDTFYVSWKYVGILLLGTVFHAFALFWAAGYHGAKKTTVILTTSIIGAMINILLNLLFIRPFGLYAVTASTVAAFLATWIIRVRKANAYFQISLPRKDMLVLFPLMLAAIMLPFFLPQAVLTVCGGVGMVVFFAYNWALFQSVTRAIRKKWRGAINPLAATKGTLLKDRK